MRASHFLFAGLVVAALGSAAACGSGGATPPTVDQLRGEYRATTSGSISKIQFVDGTHYKMVHTGCSGAACNEEGTYVFASPYTNIAFTDSTGKTTNQPFQVTSAGAPVSEMLAASYGLHVLDGLTTGSPSTSLTGSGGASSLIAMLVALIEGFLLGQQAFSGGSDAGAPTSTTPTGFDAGFGSFDSGGGFDAGFDAGGDAMDASTPQTIPVVVVTGTDGTPKATVQVSVGGGAPFTAVLDTGSVGLHVAPGVVPDSAWTVGTTTTNTVFGGNLSIDGLVTSAAVTVGSVPTNGPINVVKVTNATCVAGQPACSATGQTGAFRFQGQYGAILGVGLRANANGIASPFAAMGNSQQYFMRLPPAGSSNGTVEIDPTASEVSALATQVTLNSNNATTPSGIPGWDDTQVPFCLNNFCGNAVLDTGAPFETVTGLQMNDYTSINVPVNATTVPSGTAVQVTINQGVQWSFTVGNPAQLGVDSVHLSGTAGVNDLGLAPFRQFDVFYDYFSGIIGLEAKVSQ